MAFTTEYLETMEDATQSVVETAQYQLNGSWQDGDIISRGTVGDFRRFFCEIPSSASGNITGIRLTDANENVIYYETTNIIKSAGSAFSFEIKFKIIEAQP